MNILLHFPSTYGLVNVDLPVSFEELQTCIRFGSGKISKKHVRRCLCGNLS